jgi:hypothetical protein
MWRHSVSRLAFASRRIPLKDDVDPATCPAFENAGALHPEVALYRARQRQRGRDYRARLKHPDPDPDAGDP